MKSKIVIIAFLLFSMNSEAQLLKNVGKGNGNSHICSCIDSKGNIALIAYKGSGVIAGDSIRNKAHIYFDYNSPITTKYAVISKWSPGNGIKDMIVSKTLLLYPNPSSKAIYIKNTSAIKHMAEVYDMKGSMLGRYELKAKNETMLNVENWSKGIYLIRTTSGEIIKFVVE